MSLHLRPACLACLPRLPAAELPHYSGNEWDWLRGALATVDRDYGWLLNTLQHHIQVTGAGGGGGGGMCRRCRRASGSARLPARMQTHSRECGWRSTVAPLPVPAGHPRGAPPVLHHAALPRPGKQGRHGPGGGGRGGARCSSLGSSSRAARRVPLRRRVGGPAPPQGSERGPTVVDKHAWQRTLACARACQPPCSVSQPPARAHATSLPANLLDMWSLSLVLCAQEATEAIKPILGDYYKSDSRPLLKSMWQDHCLCRWGGCRVAPRVQVVSPVTGPPAPGVLLLRVGGRGSAVPRAVCTAWRASMQACRHACPAAPCLPSNPRPSPCVPCPGYSVHLPHTLPPNQRPLTPTRPPLFSGAGTPPPTPPAAASTGSASEQLPGSFLAAAGWLSLQPSLPRTILSAARAARVAARLLHALGAHVRGAAAAPARPALARLHATLPSHPGVPITPHERWNPSFTLLSPLSVATVPANCECCRLLAVRTALLFICRASPSCALPTLIAAPPAPALLLLCRGCAATCVNAPPPYM